MPDPSRLFRIDPRISWKRIVPGRGDLVQEVRGAPGELQGVLPTPYLPPAPEDVPQPSGVQPGTPFQAQDSDVIPEAIATWFFRLAEEMEGGDPSDPPWRTDPGDLKWSDARRYVLTRDSRACAIRSCGAEEDLTVHHILPRAWGGTHHPGNLVTLCTRCHRNLCDSCTRPVSSRVPPLYLPP
jgi:hypothetical protein